MENFQMPYSADSITEFWRRWHISLSTWFRDYLYIPLGGNRRGPVRTYINLLVTMLLCGFWHGASWNFVFWGGLHGIALALHRAWTGWDPLSLLRNLPGFQFFWAAFSRCLTLGVVLLGWLFFRAQSWSEATGYLSRLVIWPHDGIRLGSPFILSALVATIVAHLVFHKDENWAQEISTQPISLRLAHYTGLALLLTVFAVTDSSPFIYFQF